MCCCACVVPCCAVLCRAVRCVVVVLCGVVLVCCSVLLFVVLFVGVRQLSALGKKKKAQDNERISVLENARKQHNYHIGRLEQMLRLLDNNDLAPDQVTIHLTSSSFSFW